ncbi:MAG TPA: response regulator [Methanoregula sp.]|nr:response regulator [Methanoregula sp.]
MNEKIMIVDDSPFIVDGLAAILTRKGYTPVPVHGGYECLDALNAEIPDLILLDLMMEPLDGWETLEKIREKPETKDIPVLMFSAKKLTPAEAQEHSVKIDDFVSKPVNPTQLLDSIQRIFSRRNDIRDVTTAAQGRGLSSAIIDEYCALRKNIEVDKNLLVVLKSSFGMDIPGREISADDRDEIRKLEDKISKAEQRLREINNLISKPADPVSGE